MKKFMLIATMLIGMLHLQVVNATNIGDMIVRFCEEDGSLEKTVSYEMDTGEERDLCIKVINDSYDDLDVEISFVDGTITNDANQYKACKMAEETANFGQFATIINPIINVPARGATEKKFSLIYPEGFAGMSYGCIITKIVDSKPEYSSTPELFEVEVRKGNFIDISVNGSIVLNMILLEDDKSLKTNLSNNELAGIYKNNDGTYSSVVNIHNAGNISQKTNISRSYSTMFGKTLTEDLGERMILPGDTLRLESPMQDIPWYKGYVKFSYDIEHTPDFDFESNLITPEMMESMVLKQNSSWFIFPWLLLLIVIGIIDLLWLLIYRLNKKNSKKTLEMGSKKVKQKKQTKVKKAVKKKTSTTTKVKKKEKKVIESKPKSKKRTTKKPVEKKKKK